jgi:hypothetical protein
MAQPHRHHAARCARHSASAFARAEKSARIAQLAFQFFRAVARHRTGYIAVKRHRVGSAPFAVETLAGVEKVNVRIERRVEKFIPVL